MPNAPIVDPQRDRLVSFRAFIRAAEEGAPVPTVNPDDLQRLHDVSVDMTRRYSGKDGVVSLEKMARACDPGANLPAVWLRHTELRSLIRKGLLEPWKHGTALDAVVYRVAATIPLHGIQVDEQEFLRQLRGESPDSR